MEERRRWFEDETEVHAARVEVLVSGFFHYVAPSQVHPPQRPSRPGGSLLLQLTQAGAGAQKASLSAWALLRVAVRVATVRVVKRNFLAWALGAAAPSFGGRGQAARRGVGGWDKAAIVQRWRDGCVDPSLCRIAANSAHMPRFLKH